MFFIYIVKISIVKIEHLQAIILWISLKDSLLPNLPKSRFSYYNYNKNKGKQTKNKPKKEDIDKGIFEKSTIPSKEYLKSFQKDYFVYSVRLSMLIYSSHLVLKPTSYMPLENRLYSSSCKIALLFVWSSFCNLWHRRLFLLSIFYWSTYRIFWRKKIL